MWSVTVRSLIETPYRQQTSIFRLQRIREIVFHFVKHPKISILWCGVGGGSRFRSTCEFLYLHLFSKNRDSNWKFCYTNCSGNETFRMRYRTLLHRPVTFTYEYFLKPTPPPPHHPKSAILVCSRSCSRIRCQLNIGVTFVVSYFYQTPYCHYTSLMCGRPHFIYTPVV